MEAIEYYLRSPGTGLFLEISLKLIKKALKNYVHFFLKSAKDKIETIAISSIEITKGNKLFSFMVFHHFRSLCYASNVHSLPWK